MRGNHVNEVEDDEAKVKIQSKDATLVLRIYDLILDGFPESEGSPLLRSSEGGVHALLTVREVNDD